MSGPRISITDSISPDTIRVRISHSHTARNGWQHESTVELVGNAGDVVDLAYQIRDQLEQADALGRAESARRNDLDAKEQSV